MTTTLIPQREISTFPKLTLGDIVTFEHGTKMVYLGRKPAEQRVSYEEFIGWPVNFLGNARILDIISGSLSINKEGKLIAYGPCWKDEIVSSLNVHPNHAAKIHLLKQRIDYRNGAEQ